MNRKKVVVCIVLCLVVISVCACGRSAEREVKGKTIGFVQYNTRNSFYNIIQSEMQKKCDENGINLIVKDANTSATQQISAIADFIAMGVDAIIINPVDRSSLRNVILNAKNEGIVIVTVDNILEEDIPVDVSIMADNYGAGVLAGKWLAEKMGRQEIRALYLSGVEDTIVSENRRSGLIYGVIEGNLDKKELAKLEIVSRRKSDWTATGTYLAVFEIDEELNYNCIMSEAQSVALTTYQILTEKGLAEQVEYIACATTDTLSAEAIRLITGGVMASGYQNPYLFGTESVEAVMKLWQGEKVESVIKQPTILISRDNFYDYFDEQGNHKYAF